MRHDETRVKILFVIHDLSVGGAEKVLINLVNNMDYSKFEVSVLALFDEGVNKQFLNKNITYRYAFKRAIRGNSHYMKLLSPKQLYQWLIKDEYDIVVSYLEGPAARIVAGAPKERTKTVSWIHCTYHSEKEVSKSFRNNKEAYNCYNSADIMVFVSEEVRQAFLKYCPVKSQTCVLYNTNETEKIILKASEEVDNICFKEEMFYWCGVGKIVPNKGFDRMLRIQKRLIDEGYKSKLLVLGTGWQEDELKKWCDENRISEHVDFLGYQTNPYKYVSKCDLFVCASYAEGFSTATTEALIVGTPVCTVEVSGMKEMLGDNKYGVIVKNNERDLYKEIKCLIENSGTLNHYRKKAMERGKDFSTSKTVSAVENMFLKLLVRTK